MSAKLDIFKRKIKNKKVTVIGLGVSNIPLIKFLSENGAVITACDKRNKEDLTDEFESLSAYNITYKLGTDYLDNLSADIIFKTPGMRFDIPELCQARNNGSVVTSEMELFFELCDARKIAVTGSDGKTTTTTLISEMLKKQGYTVWLGGNIGNPLIDKIEVIKDTDYVVLELSSFQLHTMKSSPDISVVTNLSPNHLDMHKDMNEYIDAKRNIYLHQKETDKLVVNFDNDITHSFANDAKSEVVYFSAKNKNVSGAYLDNGVVYYKGEQILSAEEIKIPGSHNVENYMAAIAALYGIVSVDTIRYVARNFGGVEHRIELVRELDGVKYYNDSIASSPTRTTAGLNSFNEKVILIAGGYDKHIPFDDFGKVILERVKKLFLIGVTAPKIKSAAESAGFYDITVCSSLEEAVIMSRNAAQSGDIVLLSPACASFDMFKNFAQRGNMFKELVAKL